jgi:hypothetical protein
MKRCAHCNGNFGMMRQKYGVYQFCSKKCKELYLALREERLRAFKWRSWLSIRT